VKIELWNVAGKRVATVLNKTLPVGEQQIAISLKSLGLPAGNYVYQIQVSNNSGTYKDFKMMTRKL